MEAVSTYRKFEAFLGYTESVLQKIKTRKENTTKNHVPQDILLLLCAWQHLMESRF